MSLSRGLTVFLAIIGGLLILTGARYARSRAAGAGVEAVAGAAGEPSDPAGGQRAVVRLFRNPGTVAAFTATDLDGHPVSLASFKGKVVIVNFWATWCPPCRAELPDLIALQDKYRNQLQVIGISEDEGSPDDVRKFVREHGINYPVVMANKELDHLFPNVQALPTSFVLDREDRLVQKHVGMLRAETAEIETRVLAKLSVNATVEEVDQTQGLTLSNGAQAMDIPGVNLASLPASKRTEALKKLNGQACTCGCDLTVAKCRVDDPTCGVSLPIARRIVAQIAGT